MAWSLSDSLHEYSATAEGMLRAHPGRNTILLGVAATLRARGVDAFGSAPPLFGWWQEPGESVVSAAFLHTPPFPAALTSMAAETAVDLARALARRGWVLDGVNADPPVAAAFATAWHQLTGDTVGESMRSRLYQLGDLRPPDPFPAGQARQAGAADRSLLIAWSEAFHEEAQTGPRDVAGMVDDRLSYRGYTLWERAGQPVSLAGLTRQVAGQVRVGPVYTPPAQRGQGYGGAATWAVSQAARDAGASEVVLFTNLANPTSNALYQRLGYQAVADRTVLAFRKGVL
jgi:RimJ/RimL family protein N-acetyltransferase